jgi:hypothetical protein
LAVVLDGTLRDQTAGHLAMMGATEAEPDGVLDDVRLAQR